MNFQLIIGFLTDEKNAQLSTNDLIFNKW